MATENEARLLTALKNIKRCLEQENGKGDGAIRDTIWYGPGETLFDYIDSETGVGDG
jgi:hypothetical protein